MLDGMLWPGPDGGSVVAFERLVDRPVDKVWAALTIPERVADWLAEAEIDLEVGGRYDLHFQGGADHMTGVITRLEPPRLLELAWRENGGPESALLWRLEPEGDGCRLFLTHSFGAGQDDVPGFVSGWHLHLDGLQGVAGAVPWDRARWQALDRQYRAALESRTSEDRFGRSDRDGDRWKITFVRHIERPIAKVWAALIVPERISDWLGDAEVDPRVGGRYVIHFRVPDDSMTAVITAIDPPRLLEYRWTSVEDPRGALVRWELEPQGERACRLVLTQFGLPRAKLADTGSAWHDFLDMIPDAADGVATPYDVPRWQALESIYQTRLKDLAED